MEEADFASFKLPRGFLTQVIPSSKISWYCRYIYSCYHFIPRKSKICCIISNIFLKKTQILQSASKLRKFSLSYCGTSKDEMSELVLLMHQRPILPNIVDMSWFDKDVLDMDHFLDPNHEHLRLLMKTFRDKFPNLRLMAD
jgi:hypothetical protein